MKKRRLRNWFVPMFEDGVNTITESRQFPLGLIAFDNFDDAYAYAAHLRLSPMYDDKGELILDDKGSAVLPDFGKINIVEISGKKIDWKRVHKISASFHIRGLKEMRDVIEFGYQYPFTERSFVSIKEETDELYKKSTM